MLFKDKESKMVMNINQNHVAKSRPSGPVLVTGVKGSGKTSIGIKKTAFLLENYCLDPNDKILFVNNSKSFVDHSAYLRKRIEQEKEKTLMDLIQATQNNICISSIDGIVYQYYKAYCLSKNLSLEIYDEKNYFLEILYQGIDTIALKYPEITYLDKRFKHFLLAEIEWIRACGYTDEQQYQNADRIGLQDLEWEGPYKLNKNSQSRKAIFELMNYFSDYCRSKGKIDYVEANIMAMELMKAGKCEHYTHVIIDDCHELTKIQLDLIINLYKPKAYSSITFLYEDHTDCEPKSWLGNGRPFTTVGFDMTGRSKTLHIDQNEYYTENRQSCSQYNSNCDISYREIAKTEKLIEFIKTFLEENLSDKDFSIVFKNENTRFELYKANNLVTIFRKNE